jgi:hypothetical protein
MNAIRRFNRFADAHPLIAIALGLIVIVVAGLVLIPADPPDLGAARAVHSRGSV